MALLLIFHRCWKNRIDNALPRNNCEYTCSERKFAFASCRAILERLGRRKDYEERKGWKLKKGKRGFIGFAINEKRGGEGRQR